jgi:hypothetical protein
MLQCLQIARAPTTERRFHALAPLNDRDRRKSMLQHPQIQRVVAKGKDTFFRIRSLEVNRVMPENRRTAEISDAGIAIALYNYRQRAMSFPFPRRRP